MRKTRAYISFVLLLAIATILTQVPRGQKSGVRSQKSESEPRSTTPVGTGPQGSGGLSVSKRTSPQVSKQQLVETYGRLPLSFEANHGQTDASVQFLSRGSGYTLFLTANEAVLALRRSQESEVRSQNPSPDRKGGGIHPNRARAGEVRPARSGAEGSQKDAAGSSLATRGSTSLTALSVSKGHSSLLPAVLRLKLVGANPNPAVMGEDELPGKSNYFLGNDPSQWRTNVPNYAKVRYKDVYPGIDLVYYGNQPFDFARGPEPVEGRQLEYDFVVAPGADPHAIQFAVEGVDKLEVDTQGDLVIATAAEQVRFRKPLVYQETDGVHQEIAGGYALQDDGEVGFALAAYDASIPLIIDPVLVYSTYVGGSDLDAAYGMAVDNDGYVYVTGPTHSTNFPAVNSFQSAYAGGVDDAFVFKLNPSGSTLVYSTYLGGSNSDVGNAITADAFGNAYVTGGTSSSTNFPTLNAFQPAFGGGRFDAFVVKVGPSGVLLSSTYLGGSSGDVGYGVAVDGSGNVYVAGGADGSNFPTTSGSFREYFSGSGSAGCGDGFVTKLNGSLSGPLIYSTYLGGSGDDCFGPSGIDVDGSGNAYVAAATSSPNFPTVNPLQSSLAGAFDAFVTKLNAAGSALLYSTYLGGSRFDSVRGSLVVDANGYVYLMGQTCSTNFPTTAGSFQTSYGGGSCVGDVSGDVFLTKLYPDGSPPIYSTYLGGSGDEFPGESMDVDSQGNAYVTGSTSSTNFPTMNPLQTVFGGVNDAFVAKLNGNGSALLFSTYLGGSGDDGGIGIGLDSSGNMSRSQKYLSMIFMHPSRTIPKKFSMWYS